MTYYIVAEADEFDWGWSRDWSASYPGGSAWGATSDFDWAVLVSTDMVFQVYLTTVHNKIYTLQDLQDIKFNLTGNFELMNDIDASATAGWNGGLGFAPIGSIGTPFTGQLEGDGHIIYNFHIVRPAQDGVGLFGAVGNGAIVNDTGMRRVNITGHNNTGSIAGYNVGDISNCSTTGWIWGTQNYVGGLVGWNSNPGRIGYSWSYCRVEGSDYVGGLVGDFSGLNCILAFSYSRGYVIGNNYVGGLAGITDNNGAIVVKSYSTADVTSSGECAGGFSGFNYCEIRNCYATGDVSGNDKAGGFIGWNDYDIYMCYSSGHVTGTTLTDGFIGYMDTGTTANCYYDSQTSGYSTGNFYGDPQTTAALMTQSTYVSSWNFTTTWWMVDGNTRPFLRMEWSEEITNSHQLQMMQMDKSADYSLECDINLSDVTEASQMWGTNASSGAGFWPIGEEAPRFYGRFEGNNYTISNLYINRPSQDDVGLFGYISGGAIIRNLQLHDVDVMGYYPVAGLAGNNLDSTIVNVHVTGEISSTDEEVGGLVGYNWGTAKISDCSMTGNVSGPSDYIGGLLGFNNGGDVTHCFFTGNVAGDDSVGGLCGQMNSGTLSDCHADADIIGTGDDVGGLIGHQNLGTVTRCSATGSAIGANHVGGFCGYTIGGTWAESYAIVEINASGTCAGGMVGYQASGTITNCYARGNVIGAAGNGGFVGDCRGTVVNCYSTGAVSAGVMYYGGFVGYFDMAATATDCFWDVETSGRSMSDAGTGKTTAEMMQQSTFTSWDFTSIWGVVENVDYPVLRALCQADLRVDLVPNNPFANVEPNALTYTMYVTNYGPDPAFDLQLSLLLPPQMSPGTGTPLWDSFEAGYVNYSLGTIASGQTLNPYLIVNIGAYAPTLTSHASVSSSTGDPGEYPNQDSAIINVNRHPVANNDARTVKADETLAVIAPGVLANDSDPDGNTLSVIGYDATSTWGAPVAVNPDGSFTYNPMNLAAMVALGNGDSLDDFFNYTISDGASGWDTAMVTITVTGVNDAPAITTADITTTVVNTLYSVDYSASDPEDDTLAWALTTNAAWLGINVTTGVLYGTPTATGTFWVNISVHDTFPASDWSNFTLTVTDPNNSPIITTSNVLSAYVGTAYSVDYAATDADGDTLTWSLTTDAAWLGINAATGMLSGTPLLANVGTFSVNVSVSDGRGGTDFTVFTLTVINNNQAPVIITNNVPTGKVNVLYSVDYNATDADGDTLTWARQTNATWLSINAATGVLSGTPTAAGTFWVNVTVSDGNGGLAWRYFTVTVSPADPVDDGDDDDVEENIPIVIGPVLDEDGAPISGAAVTVTFNGKTYNGTTNASGFATINVPESVLGENITVAITKDGYTPISYTTALSADGTPSSQPQSMMKTTEPVEPEDDEPKFNSMIMMIIIILVIAGVIAAVLWFRQKGPKPESAAEQPAPPGEPLPEQAPTPDNPEQ